MGVNIETRIYYNVKV